MPWFPSVTKDGTPRFIECIPVIDPAVDIDGDLLNPCSGDCPHVSNWVFRHSRLLRVKRKFGHEPTYLANRKPIYSLPLQLNPKRIGNGNNIGEHHDIVCWCLPKILDSYIYKVLENKTRRRIVGVYRHIRGIVFVHRLEIETISPNTNVGPQLPPNIVVSPTYRIASGEPQKDRGKCQNDRESSNSLIMASDQKLAKAISVVANRERESGNLFFKVVCGVLGLLLLYAVLKRR
jgi:hypothetical protein